MVLPPKFESRASAAGPASRDESSQRAELERSLQATRLLGDHERVDSRRGELAEAISITHDRQELFVSSAPAMALAQQFRRQRPEFIAVHDIGCQWSRRLLAGIATASGRSLAHLDIRQEGDGAILARLEYVECPTNDGSSLRLYSTDIVLPPGADPATADASREQIALALLAHARLGVAIVGDMPISAMRSALAPLDQGMQQGPWPSRQLLLLPLTSAGALASLGSEFSEDTGVTVRSTPQVSRTGDAWAFISGTWNRLRDELMRRELGYGGQGIKLPALPGARRTGAPLNASTPVAPATAPATEALTPVTAAVPAPVLSATMSPITPAGHGPSAARTLDESQVRQLVMRVGELPGLVACTVFAREAAAHYPESPYVAPPFLEGRNAPDHAVLVAQGRALRVALELSSAALGRGDGLCEAMVNTQGGHVLLRAVPLRPDLLLIAVFEATEKPLLHDLQLRRIEADIHQAAPA